MSNIVEGNRPGKLTTHQVSWIGGGFAAALATLPGQTVYIAQFNDPLRAQFALTHGEFGGIFMFATLASAVILTLLGGLVDRFEPRLLAVLCIAGLAVASLAMAANSNVIVLMLLLLSLRFFGQGMLGHIVASTMARWFDRFRGRALSISGLGNPVGTAFLPLLATISIGAFGWRETWVITAVILVALFAPVVWYLLNANKGQPRSQRHRASPVGAAPVTGSGWTRGRVLRDPLFYLIMVGVIAPPAIGTLYIFHQTHLIALKGWDLAFFAAVFPLMPGAAVAVSLVGGGLVDRFGAWRVLPYILLPNAAACLLIAMFSAPWSAPLFLISIGMTNGLLSPVVGAIWAELYGTAHLGAVRSVAMAAIVAASALGPGISGALIDWGVELDAQGFGYAAYCLAATLVAFAVGKTMHQRVQGLVEESAA